MRWAALVVMAFAVSAEAQGRPYDRLMLCSAHFEARATWIEKSGGSDRERREMSRLAEIALDDLAELFDTRDWGMVAGPGRDGPVHLLDARDVRALNAMTEFAEGGFGETGLPSCKDDPVCRSCADLVSASAGHRN